MPEKHFKPPFEPAVSIFMLVKTKREWLDFPPDQRFELLAQDLKPLLDKYRADIRLRFYDVEFYSARVTDIWLWEARDHHAYQLLVEDLRETPSGTAISRSSRFFPGWRTPTRKTTIARQ